LIKLRSYLNSDDFKSNKTPKCTQFNKDTEIALQTSILSIISQLRPQSINIKKESLLKTFDQLLFVRCEMLFRNKMKAAVNDISFVNHEASTSAKSTPTGLTTSVVH
jgi:hypothetical protein